MDRATYDHSIETLRTAIHRAKLGRRDKIEAFKRLSLWENETRQMQVSRPEGVCDPRPQDTDLLGAKQLESTEPE